MAKNIDSRIMHKHDTEENWKKAINFIPKSGELIIYDTDENHPFPRTKIGNGILKINELPFSSFSIENYRKTVSQNLILSLSDISLDSHKIGVNLRSKNLIPYPYFHTTKTENGVTFTDNGDGSITINGTATNTTLFILSRGINFFSTNVYLGAGVESKVSEGLCLSQRGTNISNVKINYELWSGGVGALFINCTAGETFNNVTVYPQLEIGSTSTPYTPYVADDTAVTVKSCGKNLIPYPHVESGQTKNDVTFTSNNDGSVTINGTPTVNTTYIIAFGKIFSGYIGCNVGNSATKDGLCISLTGDQNVDVKLAFELNAGRGGLLYILVKAGITYNNVTVYPQLEVGTVATLWEPYIEGETVETILKGGAELTSISPNMTISSSIEGVVVEATYNSMCFDEKWNGLINSAIDAISNSDIDKLFIDTKGGVDR